MHTRFALVLALTSATLASAACQGKSEAPTPPATPKASPPATPVPTPAAPSPAPITAAPAPAPGSLRAPATPEVAASFQSCTTDDQCSIVGNGCCEPGGPEPTIGIRSDQATTFKALFNCDKAVCRTSSVVACKPMPPCTRDDCTLAEIAGCVEVEAPVAKCVAGRCAVIDGE